MPAVETEYANTDLDLVSLSAFDTLVAELGQYCHLLSYTLGNDKRWYAVVEAEHGQSYTERTAALDILSIVQVLKNLTSTARFELDSCDRRDFNIGFHCWDKWSYNHHIPNAVLKAIAEINGTLSVTLYPMRNVDGSPKV